MLLKNLALLSIFASSLAHAGEPHSDQQVLDHYVSISVSASLTVSTDSQASPLTCGQVITKSTRLTHDLYCPDTLGFAVSVQGDNIHLDGNEHTIFAPKALAGVYIQGKNIRVKRLRVNSVANGYGIFAYDSPGVRIINNELQNNQIGIQLFSENVTMKNSEVRNNYAAHNTLFGIRTGQFANGSMIDPDIHDNDFSYSGSYALYIQAKRDRIGVWSGNDLSYSTGGLYLKDGAFEVRDISLSQLNISTSEIFVDSAASLILHRADLSSPLPAKASQERVGLHLYKVGSFQISELTTDGQDVGINIETSNDVRSYGLIKTSSFQDNTVAGVVIRSTDGTPYNGIVIRNNLFSEKSPSVEVQNPALAPVSKVQEKGLRRFLDRLF